MKVSIYLDLDNARHAAIFDELRGPQAPPEYANAPKPGPEAAFANVPQIQPVAAAPPAPQPVARMAQPTIPDPTPAPQAAPAQPAASIPAPQAAPPANVNEDNNPRKQLSQAMMKLFQHDAKLAQATSDELKQKFGSNETNSWSDEQVGQAITILSSKTLF